MMDWNRFMSLLLTLWLPMQPAGADPRLGTNLAEVVDWSTELPFIDLFKMSRQWLPQCHADSDPGCDGSNAWDTGEQALLDLDAQGWVRSLPDPEDPAVYTHVASFWAIDSRFPGGRYLVLYDGRGRIDYRLGATRIDAESTPGRDLIQIDPANGGVQMRILATDPADYIRNIRVVREQDEAIHAERTFNSDFLERIRPFEALRFMDWMRTNGSPLAGWAGRPLPSDYTYTSDRGVPLEVMIDLANELHRPPWFTLPHQADDDFVVQFAQTVAGRLDSGLDVYIEYSNEVWNGSFSQGDWVERQAQAQWPGGSNSGFTKRMNWYGKRSAEICDLWKQVWGGRSGRVTCVMAGQAANSWVVDQALRCPLWSQAPCGEHGIGTLAIAPYFGQYLGSPEYAGAVEAWRSEPDGGLTRLFAELTAGGQLPGAPEGGALAQAFQWIDAHRHVAAEHRLAVSAYEGGQHLVGYQGVENNQTITDLFVAANLDPRMGALYGDYLGGWKQRGGGLLMSYTDIASPGKWGSFGVLGHVGDMGSPKYDALLAYLASGAGAATAVLGTNLAAVSDKSTQLPFLDLFKLSRDWITQCDEWGSPPDPACSGNSWDTGEEHLLDLDADGWIRSLPAPGEAPTFTRAATYLSLYPEFPLGRHLVLYEGEGTLEYRLGAALLASAPGRDLIEIDPTAGGVQLIVAATDPNGNGDYLRNIRIIPEAEETAFLQGQVFNPTFLERTRPYQVLRFADWMNADATDLSDWSQRPLPSHARYTGDGGVPLERMIELADALEKSPWFVVPSRVDDAFVQRFAELVHANLDPGRSLYVEYSSGAWSYIEAQGEDTWPSSGADSFTKGLNWYGKRTAEICAIWKQVWGEDAQRVRCVIGDPDRVPCVGDDRAAFRYAVEQVLDCSLWEAGPCVDFGVDPGADPAGDGGIDALAIAPYFGAYLAAPQRRSELLAWPQAPDGGLGRLFAELLIGGELGGGPSGGALAQAGACIDTSKLLADGYQIELMAYAGGQGMADPSGGLPPDVATLFHDANRDPRMGEVYQTYLEAWRQRGGGVFIHRIDIAAYDRYGSWGTLEQFDQASSAKYDALLTYLSEQVRDLTVDDAAKEADHCPRLANRTPMEGARRPRHSEPSPDLQPASKGQIRRHRAGEATGGSRQ